MSPSRDDTSVSSEKKKKEEQGDEPEVERPEHTFEDWDDVAADPEEEASRFVKAVEGLVPDILKRGISAGVNSRLISEDGLRSLMADKKLPKEVVSYLIGQADATKRELLRIVSREIRVFLENMDFGGEIAKILTSISFEIRTEIRFIPNDAAVKPNVRNRVNVKKARRDDLEDEAEALEEAAVPAEDGEDKENGNARRVRRWPLRKRVSEDEQDEQEEEK